jgi:4-phospho-D-threonate 3-dehydrogenase / 4-phospho-D-erythronate 3-dehydrogenase
MTKPRIGITIGDPCGIGPEIALKAAASPALRERAQPVLIGSRELLAWGIDGISGETGAALARALADPEIAILDAARAETKHLRRGEPSAEGGRVSVEAVRAGVRAILRGELDAIATAPISKTAWRLAGVAYPGHTELLAELGRSPSYGMLFVAGGLRVLLATIHVPLAAVPSLLTTEGVLEKLRLLGQTLSERFGVRVPKIGVAGLNPHAGEGGQFGDEEARILAPAIARARDEGLDVGGPFPADVLFGEIYARDSLDAVLAMYHDQGLIPVKQAAFGSAVNVTIGLPFIRTSPDHGTAYDIAGRGVARESSLVAAALLAAEMAARAGERAARGSE